MVYHPPKVCLKPPFSTNMPTHHAGSGNRTHDLFLPN
uniref:Uncharacterized protein n=1 Tax=Arundo donax TaxID=35708 RepID=A0A0A9BJC0_ARUDO